MSYCTPSIQASVAQRASESTAAPVSFTGGAFLSRRHPLPAFLPGPHFPPSLQRWDLCFPPGRRARRKGEQTVFLGP